MPTFSHSIDIDATPEQVWAVMGDLVAVDRWVPGIAAVAVEGMSRVCTFQAGHTQHEQILDYSPQTRSYRYQIEGAPLPVTQNTGSFQVQEAGAVSRVVWESSFTPLDPAMADQLATMWEPYLPLVLANLKSLVEGVRIPRHPR